MALLYNNGLVKDYADLYELTVDQILPLERMAQKSAENLVNGVQKSKAVPFERVLFAIGIRYVGETVAKKLAKHYKSIDAIRNASLMDLILVASCSSPNLKKGRLSMDINKPDLPEAEGLFDRIIQFSINNAIWVMMFVIAWIGVGIYSYQKLSIDAVPDITNVQVQINSQANGFTAPEVEQRITYPIENAMSGIPNLEQTRSISRYGVSARQNIS